MQFFLYAGGWLMIRPLLKFSLFPVLILFLPGSLTAGLEFAGWFSSGWPQGKLKSYAYDFVSAGGTARMSWGFGEKSSVEPFFFTEFSYADFGIEKGYVPDPYSPEAGEDVATDFYLMMFSSGFALSKRFGDYRPYCNFFGGVSYYSALSRISSRKQNGTSGEFFTESSGPTWHTGIGVGAKVLIWRKKLSTAEAWLDKVFFDIRVDFTRGGVMEYLNWRSFRDDAGTDSFEKNRSNIEIFLLSLGASFVF